jgi:hypothetical protein
MPADDDRPSAFIAALRARRRRGSRLSVILAAIAADRSRERISIGDLLELLSHRAFGALIFIFAVPNCIPTPPGTSSILGAPLLFLATQLALNRPKPWLPSFITRRSIARRDFAKVIDKVMPWLRRAERLLRPRVSFLTYPPFEQAIGVVCLLLAIVLFLPIPLGNMLPALAISLFALSILERDGLAAIAGLLVGLVSVAVAWGVVFALVKAGIFFLHQFFAPAPPAAPLP